MDHAQYTDRELLKGCISGSKKEWDSFLDKYSRLVYHTIYKTLRVHEVPINSDDVNDLFQEVVTSLCAEKCKKLRVFDPEKGCSLSSWLRMIAVRMTIDHLRKSRTLSSVDELPVEPSQAGEQESIADQDSVNAVKELLKLFPAKDKLLIELSYMRELPPEEVAQILGISVGAFYTRKNRILE
jgi:RNA polymerase sigma factor (sigma-70 family)